MRKILARAKVIVAGYALLVSLGFMQAAEAQLYGDLAILGPVSAKVSGRTGSFKMASLDNNGDPAYYTGTIEVAMWVTRKRYTGGTISGAKILKCRYDGLWGGYQYPNLSCRGRISSPRRGSYYVTLTAAEYDAGSGQFYTGDFASFPKKIRFR